MNIHRIITIKRYHVIVAGFVCIVNQPSVERLGTESWIAIVPPQRIEDAAPLKTIGWRWFKPGISKGDPHE